MYKNKLRFLHDKFSQFEVDFLFELEKIGKQGVQLPNCMYLMVKRIMDAGYCDRHIRHSGLVFVIRAAEISLATVVQRIPPGLKQQPCRSNAVHR